MRYRTIYQKKAAAAIWLVPVVLAVALFSCSRTIERPTEANLPIDAPPTPASIVVSVGDQTVDLSWTPVDEAVRYRVYRAERDVSRCVL